MKILKVIISAIIILQHFTIFAILDYKKLITNKIQASYLNQCTNIAEKDTLTTCWRKWDPYQFSRINANGNYIITGLDIEIMNEIAKRIGVNIKYEEVDWEQTQLDIKDGNKDVATGSTYVEEKTEFANFSIPYRFEEISLFTLRTSIKQLNFHNINEFLAQIRLLNFRLGIVKKTIYGNIQITNFLNHKSNDDIIEKYQDEIESFNALMKQSIDGFISDRIVGTALILTNEVSSQIQETPLDIKTPVHFMFSKKTVPLDLVEHFNNVIKEFIVSDDYKKIMTSYVYHILLSKAIDSEWCYIIGLIGSIAFAISGITIATKNNLSFFGTFLLAIIPSIGGSILLDIVATNNADRVNFILTPSYIYYIFITVIIGFSTIKLLDYYNKHLYEDSFIDKLWAYTIVINDALGQASFIVIGVITVVVIRIEPLIFWGPCFAFLTSNGGIILRNLIRNDSSIACISKTINPEISILWGLIFSILLNIYGFYPEYNTIKYSIIIVVAGAFITRLLIYYFNIPNLKFRAENLEDTEYI